ncbi:MAG: LPS export ABC transporter ATP-binding protein [Vulcanimicrobiota bacterium]
MTLIAEALTKSYGGRIVAQDISLEVEAGEVVALLGPNGAGKTTVFSILAGHLRAEQGAVKLATADVTAMPAYQRSRLGLAYLPQESSVFRRASVWQNLAILPRARGQAVAALEAKAEDLLAQFSLAALRNQSAATLSGGERRRLELARALMLNPTYLLLDEPFAGLDPVTIDDLRELVGRLAVAGLGVLITDHNVRAALEVATRGYVIVDGRILLAGTADEIRRDPKVREHYLGATFNS